jgi:hypothetical protein
MFVELQVMDDYERFPVSNGLRSLRREVLSENCAKTCT